MAKLVLTTWAACLARQKPVSTRAKPACMKITRTAPMVTHRMLVAIPRPSAVDVSGGVLLVAHAAPPVISRVTMPVAPATTASFSPRRREGGSAMGRLLSDRERTYPGDAGRCGCFPFFGWHGRYEQGVSQSCALCVATEADIWRLADGQLARRRVRARADHAEAVYLAQR